MNYPVFTTEEVLRKWRTYPKPLEELTEEELKQYIFEHAEHNLAISLGLKFSTMAIKTFFNTFRCERCGNCCEGSRYREEVKKVYLFERDIQRISKWLRLKRRELVGKFLERSSLQEKGEFFLKLPCVFHGRDYSKSYCSIYEVRPVVCRLFPLETSEDLLLSKPPLMVNAGCPAAQKAALLILKAVREAKNRKLYQKAIEEAL